MDPIPLTYLEEPNPTCLAIKTLAPTMNRNEYLVHKHETQTKRTKPALPLHPSNIRPEAETSWKLEAFLKMRHASSFHTFFFHSS